MSLGAKWLRLRQLMAGQMQTQLFIDAEKRFEHSTVELDDF